MDTLRNETFAQDIRWTWPGSGPLAGAYNDADAVFGLFGKLFEGSGGTFKVDPESIIGFGAYVIVCARASWEDSSGSHVDPYVQTFRMSDGKAVECCMHLTDLELWDAFPAQ